MSFDLDKNIARHDGALDEDTLTVEEQARIDAEASAAVEPKVTHIGGRMYGDGEFVVTFSGGGSTSPLKATVMSHVSGQGVEITLGQGHTKQSIGLAGQAIETARRVLK